MDLMKDIKEIILEASEGNITMADLDAVGDRLDNLGMDSLIMIQIVVLIEEKFDTSIDIDTIEPHVWGSLSAFCDLVSQNLSNVSTN